MSPHKVAHKEDIGCLLKYESRRTQTCSFNFVLTWLYIRFRKIQTTAEYKALKLQGLLNDK